MLKLIRVLLLMFVVSPANAQELHTGDTLPAGLQLHDLKTGQPITTASLKGKAVIIDCWATWCAPCIEGMKDLESWQQQFKDNLVVLAVSGERPDRLKQFMKNRPGAVKIISDTAGIVSTLFPHRTIPHTVLIGTDGRVKAITAAENVSTKLVQQLIAGQPVDLPLKKDKLEFDLAAYFNSDTSLSRQFNIQPGVEGQPSFSKTYPNTAFDQRRITIVNGTMRLLYQIAYRKSFFRMADEYN
ncbi:MAG TPA: TlpA disulfide reductase family protein, partial [Chitinophagaceae bacterium]|nr:TlpA disulfide reductase family protein [Chitinophagaceae bacterium]